MPSPDVITLWHLKPGSLGAQTKFFTTEPWSQWHSEGHKGDTCTQRSREPWLLEGNQKCSGRPSPLKAMATAQASLCIETKTEFLLSSGSQDGAWGQKLKCNTGKNQMVPPDCSRQHQLHAQSSHRIHLTEWVPTSTRPWAPANAAVKCGDTPAKSCSEHEQSWTCPWFHYSYICWNLPFSNQLETF